MSYMVSTKGRYALRVMLDLAENGGDGYLTLTDVSKRQDISQKYMEAIMPGLVKSGLVEAAHGKNGGYRLARPAETYTVGEVLRASEGPISSVACLDGMFECPRADTCRTLPIWKKLNEMIDDYLNSLPLTDFIGTTADAD
jgi:Rrf2 family protein